MFDNNQAGMGYNPLAGNLRRQQVPQGMLDVWAWKHKKMITRFNEAEIKLQNYQKL